MKFPYLECIVEELDEEHGFKYGSNLLHSGTFAIVPDFNVNGLDGLEWTGLFRSNKFGLLVKFSLTSTNLGFIPPYNISSLLSVSYICTDKLRSVKITPTYLYEYVLL